MKKLNVFSVCSGIEGLGLPFHQDKNFNIVGFSEINKHCNAVLKYHYPEIKNYGDINQIRAEELSDLDISVQIGGTPCQNLSVSGDGLGLDGEKSRLFFSFTKILKENRPNYFIWENVLGSLFSQDGWDFARVQMELAEAGYHFRWEVLNAKDYGIPQKRERVFILGVRGDYRGREALFKTAKSKTVNSVERTKQSNPDVELFAWSSSGRSWGREHRITKEFANTLTTSDGCSGQSTSNYIREKDRVRKLTPNECEQLMGMPRDFTKYGDYDGVIKEVSKRERYRMCGNGVVPQCVEPIKELILEIEGRS